MKAEINIIEILGMSLGEHIGYKLFIHIVCTFQSLTVIDYSFYDHHLLFSCVHNKRIF